MNVAVLTVEEQAAQPRSSCIPMFHKLPLAERWRRVEELGLLSQDEVRALISGRHTLPLGVADRMIENVVGVMGMPVGLALNFLINGKNYVVPLVVEEPSIVAALSAAAKLVRQGGGFSSHCRESLLIGQVQAVELPDPLRARRRLLEARQELLDHANGLHPRMVARGGGARDIEVFLHTGAPTAGDMLVMHLLVDTCNAMGANMINSMCEGVAPLVEKITGGKVFLRILSNLTDRSIVNARASVPLAALAGRGNRDPEKIRDGIIIASEFAALDPYRAATHNKGVMNGIDAVALATGNDWRALEAGAHAWAARGGAYTSLTRWYRAEDGGLAGEISIPIKVGTVGGPLQTNPTVGLNHRILGIGSARELAQVMGAVGLGQNLAALKALATEGIQKGHMTLHARSVAQAAGADPEIFETVVERLIEVDEIKVWKAAEIIADLKSNGGRAGACEERATAHGKVILLGEHGVVFGRHAVAGPVPMTVGARVREGGDGIRLIIPRWSVEHRIDPGSGQHPSYEGPATTILERLGLMDRHMTIEVFPELPRAMGLGGSAALAVAIIRALDKSFALGLTDTAVSELALEAEKLAHGNPSGIDNAIAALGQFILFRRGEPPEVQSLVAARPLQLVIGISGVSSLTAAMVARVQRGWEARPAVYERIFDQMDQLALEGAEMIRSGDEAALGELMNINHGLLNALQVSCPEIEMLVDIARRAGALGAKVTGAGGGGAMVALAEDPAPIVRAISDAGFEARAFTLG